MKRITTYGAVLALCLASGVALGATAILIEPAEVHKSATEVIDTLPLGTKVTTGKVSGKWVAVTYTKPNEEAAIQGWVQASALEEIAPGYDARVSEHCIVHAESPGSLLRFDLSMAEELYDQIAHTLVNAEGEPPFAPKVKLRVYLLTAQTFGQLAKRARQPSDVSAFSPELGRDYLNFSLGVMTPELKGSLVHEFARLVLFAYANQPRDRRGAGAPLPTWLVEAFATAQEYLAGFNTEDIRYVSDRPKLSTLTNARGVPSHERNRREYLATAGTLGHMLLNRGTREQFSHMVRILQTEGASASAEALMLGFYQMTRVAFQSEWAKYVDQLKTKYGIREIEKEIEKERENRRGLVD